MYFYLIHIPLCSKVICLINYYIKIKEFIKKAWVEMKIRVVPFKFCINILAM